MSGAIRGSRCGKPFASNGALGGHRTPPLQRRETANRQRDPLMAPHRYRGNSPWIA